MHPFIHVTDSLILPSYMLILSLTYCLGLGFAFLRAREQDQDIHVTLDLALTIMVAGFVGARLFHAVYENPEIYLAHPSDIFRFWNGGFVYYGGLIGALFGSLIYCHFKKINFWQWADFFTPVMSGGYVLGRFACFFNGCCYGALCELPWAVEFNHPGLPLGLRHPAPLYASLFELFVFGFLLFIERKRRTGFLKSQLQNGDLFLIWLMLHGCGRIVMEKFRDDFRGADLAGLSISTWLSIAMVISALIIIRLRHRKNA